ncbi:MAG: sulfotransferase [Phenylobacterium sp.]|uniref:sulfotransferase family protein n=1 Tax=Phenylobacterium sp. TaxID=1871053 RepID=UPI001A39CD79|nr:sulfotransferase [Phenylobacterium sp.]MBL8555033.1 sulfotransferase [Phenylobacterium sp.]
MGAAAGGESRPIFIVGPSRSGTELLRSVLNRHPEIWIAHETHYFDDLRPRLRRPAEPASSEDAVRIARYFEALRRRAYGLGAPDDAPVASVAETDPDTAFADYCREQANARGRRRWGEKTPRHVFRIDEILSAFPNARILAMARDPRAVVASYRDWQNRWIDRKQADVGLAQALDREHTRVRRSYDLTLATLLWRAATAVAGRAAQARPESVRVVRFEDLLSNPEGAVRGIVDWLGVDYHGDLLDVHVVNSSYVNPAAERGFVRDMEARWRDALSAAEIAYIDALAGAVANRLGYARSGERLRVLFTARALLAAPWAAGRAAMANRARIARLGPYVLARLEALRR